MAAVLVHMMDQVAMVAFMRLGKLKVPVVRALAAAAAVLGLKVPVAVQQPRRDKLPSHAGSGGNDGGQNSCRNGSDGGAFGGGGVSPYPGGT